MNMKSVLKDFVVVVVVLLLLLFVCICPHCLEPVGTPAPPDWPLSCRGQTGPRAVAPCTHPLP